MNIGWNKFRILVTNRCNYHFISINKSIKKHTISSTNMWKYPNCQCSQGLRLRKKTLHS